jgi:hypothetical protein
MTGMCSSCNLVLIATCSSVTNGPHMSREHGGGSESAYNTCVDVLGRAMDDRCDICAVFSSPSSCNYQPCVSDQSCSGHGICDVDSGSCACNATWAGFKCDQDAACMALGQCDTHATCTWSADRTEAFCSCSIGWRGSGQQCSPYVGQNDVVPQDKLEPGWIVAIALASLLVVGGLVGFWFFGRKYCIRRKPVSSEPYADISSARHEVVSA